MEVGDPEIASPTQMELHQIPRRNPFLKRTTPAHCFRPLSSLAQLLSLAGLVASWPVAAVGFVAEGTGFGHRVGLGLGR